MRWSPLSLPDARDELVAATGKQVRAARIEGGQWVARTIDDAVREGDMSADGRELMETELRLNDIAADMAADVEQTLFMARDAQLTWVTRDMTRLALDASRDMPDWSPAAVVPFPSGLLIWDGSMPSIPVTIPQGDGALGPRSTREPVLLPVAGILWGPTRMTELTARAQKWKGVSDSADRLSTAIERLGFGAVTVTVLGKTADITGEGSGLRLNSRYGRSTLTELGSFNLPGRFTGEVTLDNLFDDGNQLVFDARIGATIDAIRSADQRADMISMVKAIGATWSLMMQPQISRQSREWHDPDPNRRGKPPRKTGEVTIIDLRPMRAAAMPKEAAELTGRKAYTCRWVVRGHWRQQACGPNRSLRKPVWIASYIAGPEGLPLKITEHVHVWRR